MPAKPCPVQLVGPVASALLSASLSMASAHALPPATSATSIGEGSHATTGIAWRQASSDADVDAAFASARSENKPVFVYWGANWCPPCNQVKATLFNRQDFIERSRGFIPVYVDGDARGAQKLGARFKVSGYPTMVLFSPQGAELTRLPGEVDAQRYTQVLTLGMNAQKPIKDVLAQAEAGGAHLTANDWRLLAFYSWDTDEQQLVAKPGVPALLERLADACPADPSDTAIRLRLEALAAVGAKAPARPNPRALATVLQVLGDAAAARSYMDVLTNDAPDITRALTRAGTPQRAELLDAFDAALKRLETDTTLSRADRLTALIAQVDLARIDTPEERKAKAPLPAPLLTDMRDQVARADREVTDGYERQSVITTAAYLLQHAGLGSESDALLEANLARSHSPYYLMSELASNAKDRGDKAGALRWYREAYDRSEGPATRLQWGASLVDALVELAPRDDARIEQAASQLFAEAAKQPDAFYERSGRSLQRVGSRLEAWNKSGAHAATLKRLRTRLDGVCAALPPADPQRPTCASVLKSAAA